MVSLVKGADDRRGRRHGLLSFFIVLLILTGAVTQALAFDRLVVFGDSLSDNGNDLRYSRLAHAIDKKIPILPISPYWQGRFSNGPVWADDFAQLLHLKTSQLTDLALGGSWVEPEADSGFSFPTNLAGQISFYKNTHGLDAKRARHLYVIWDGGNDYLVPRNNIELTSDKVSDGIVAAIKSLQAYGARDIVVMDLPDLSQTPRVQYAAQDTPGFIEQAQLMVKRHNEKLASKVHTYLTGHPQLHLIFVQVSRLFQQVQQHPAQFGLVETHKPCFRGPMRQSLAQQLMEGPAASLGFSLKEPVLRSVVANQHALIEEEAGQCAEPAQYLFWDEVHPTAYVHQVIAQKVCQAVSDSLGQSMDCQREIR